MVAQATAEQRAVASKAHSPPKAFATAPRPNPPNSELRRFYERGDLPIVITQGASKAKLNWKVPVSDARRRCVILRAATQPARRASEATSTTFLPSPPLWTRETN